MVSFKGSVFGFRMVQGFLLWAVIENHHQEITISKYPDFKGYLQDARCWATAGSVSIL